MFRYLVLATILVLGSVAVVAGLQRAHAPLRVASVQSTGSPSPPRRQAGADYDPGKVSGVAPWALDALLDCFHHVRSYDGSLAKVTVHVPRDARRLRARDVVVSGACTLRIGRAASRVTRGPDSRPNVDYRLPGSVGLYLGTPERVAPDGAVRDLYVLRSDGGRGRLERLRTAAPTRVELCCKV